MNMNVRFQSMAFALRTHRLYLCATFALLALISICSLAVPAQAYADVRKADVILGDTVENRGLNVADCPDIAAEFAYVVDEDGTVYFQRDGDEQTKIASVTKIMTAVVALDSVPMDTEITVSEKAASIGESSAELQEGDTMPLSEALKALMVPSGNDAAEAIAESLGALMLESEGKDSSDADACCQAFVDAMNAKAQELGMSNTNYTNPHGLDDEEYEGDMYSSAHDVATLCAYAMQKDGFRDLCDNETETCTVTRDGKSEALELESTDELLGVYEGTCGIKTGFTDTAGACFAGACNRDDKDLYAIVLKSTDEAQRFTDCVSLWDWVYNNTVEYRLANANETTTDEATGENVPLVAKVAATSWIDKTVNATLEDPDAIITVFSLEGNISQSVEYEKNEGAIKAGQKLGTITYKQHNEVVATADIVATESLAAPNPLETIGIFFQRIGRVQKTAENVFLNDSQILNDKSTSN